LRYRWAVLLMFAAQAGMAQRGGGAARGAGRPAGLRPSTPALVNPWANPYLPFAQRLQATVSGSWAGTLPTRAPIVRRGANPVGNGWMPSYWQAPPPVPAYGWNGPPPNPYPIYPPPPPLPMAMPVPPAWSPALPPLSENIAEPPPPVQISERHAIRRPDPPALAEADPNEEYPAIIELKNGSVYTVTNYWVTGKTLHFVTTHFDHLQVPAVMLERLAPGKPGNANARAKNSIRPVKSGITRER
jgi:hypothetical protein